MYYIFLNVEIPAGSFGVFLVVSLTLWIVFYNCVLVPLLRKYTSHQQGLTPPPPDGHRTSTQYSSQSATYAIIESRRRRLQQRRGLKDGTSAVHLTRSEKIGAFTQFPKSMSSIAEALTHLKTTVSNLAGTWECFVEHCG
ncbi:hypothetical protein Leryth_025342 [Lithospermum erythrorhizon]|nr:hypothetical protein Leryth_025342 [Lithospermum erythrorhizon]